MINIRNCSFPGPGWWKHLTIEQFLEGMCRYNRDDHEYEDVEYTHDLVEKGRTIGEAGNVDVVFPGYEVAHISDRKGAPVYCEVWRGAELRPREPGSKPFPQKGWWKGLTISDFRTRLREFNETTYYSDEVSFTHKIVRAPVMVRDKKLRNDVIGLAGEVDYVLPIPAIRPNTPKMILGFLWLSHVQNPVYCVITQLFHSSQIIKNC